MLRRPHLPRLRRFAALTVPALALLTVAGPAAAHATTHPARAHRPALQVGLIKPSGAAASGTAPIVVHVTQPLPKLADVRSRPTISPAVPGRWSETGPRTLVFTPTSAQLPLSHVVISVPASLRDAAGASLGHAATDDYTVADGSDIRLTQLLSQLGYLPTRDATSGSQPGTRDNAAQRRALFAVPGGRLEMTSGWPSALAGLVSGDQGVVLRGAVMAFQSATGLPMTGTVTRDTWADLITARVHGTMNPSGYTYAYASESSPESLTIYHDGHVVARSAANTGIPASPTQTGTFPVYSRLRSQIMRGTDPDGASYADPVQYVAYFNGGDAVHYIARGAYGYPQSLGCVELPLAAAAHIWPYLTYGTLVTVAP